VFKKQVSTTNFKEKLLNDKSFPRKKMSGKIYREQTDRQTERTKEEIISHQRLTTRQGDKKLCDV
jgi:hypothetical protein